jgi:nitrile hydratase accessory protein
VKVDRLVADMPVPRSNGELVFDAPWQSRAFGLAVALHEQGVYEWSAFSRTLAEEIAPAGPDDGSRYYEHWLAALERLLREQGVVVPAELEAEAAALAAHDEHEHHDHHQ